MINIGNLAPGWIDNEHMVQKLGWQMVNLPMEVRNAGSNHIYLEAGHNPTIIPKTIEILEALFKQPGRVQSMEACPKGSGPLLLIASGSSVDPIMPKLKEWPGKIICSTSHASTLSYYGRPADYVVCMDPRTAVVDNELDMPDFGDSVLLAQVSIPTPYVERWLSRARGNIYLSRLMEPTYAWYSHHLPQQYPWVNHVMLPMIDSGAAMIAFGTWLGYNPIYLAGLDYGGPRFQRWDWNYETQTWKPDVVSSGYVARPEGNYAGMTAAGVMAYSARGALMSAFMQMANPKYKQRIYNLSSVSILRQFPLTTWDKAVADDPPAWTDEQLANSLDEIDLHLAMWDTFLVPIKAGFGTDYHTYILKAELDMAFSMIDYNRRIRVNRQEFERIEKQFNGTPILHLIRNGMVSIEAGDLLLRGSDELGDWNWREMQEIDIGPVLGRLTEVAWPSHEAKVASIIRALHDVDVALAKIPESARDVAAEGLLGYSLARRRYLLAEGKRRGYERPVNARVVLTQEMVDQLKAQYEKTPQDEHLRLKLLAMQQGLVKVGEELPPNGMYPMPMPGQIESMKVES